MSKKGAKKKRVHVPKAEDGSTQNVVFGLMTELHARGIEKGAYRWCLQKNADPKRSVVVVFIPSDMPNGVICAVMARTLNRGLVRIVDSTKSDGQYQTVLLEAEGQLGNNAVPTLISCEDCPLKYWIMVSPVEDKDFEATALKNGLLAKNPVPAKSCRSPPCTKEVSAAKGNRDTPAAKEAPPAAKEAPPAAKEAPPAAKEAPPAAKEAPPAAKEAPPAAKEAPPAAKEAPPAAKEAPPAAKEAPPAAKEAPPAAKEAPPAAKEAPPAAKEAPPAAKEAPPAEDTPAARKSAPAQVTLANREATSAEGNPAAEVVTSAGGTPAAKGSPPAQGGPDAKKATSAEGTPAANVAPPATKEATSAERTPAAKGDTSAGGTPAAKGVALAAKEATSAGGTPAAKEAPSAKGAPAAKEAPAERGITVAKEIAFVTGNSKGIHVSKKTPPIAKQALSSKCTPAGKEVPSAKGINASKKSPAVVKLTDKGTPASKEVFSAQSTLNGKHFSSAKGTSAGKDSLHAKKNESSSKVPTTDILIDGGLRFSRGGPPARVIFPAKDSLLEKLQPATKNLPPTKGLQSARDPSLVKRLPAVMVASPAKDLPVTRNEVKPHPRFLKGESLQTPFDEKEHFGRVLIKAGPHLNFGNYSRSDFPEVSIKAESEVWGGFSMERQIRKEDIEKGLQFIQSTIPFHGTEDDYKRFLQKLVEDLFTEGNDLYREDEVKLALGQYTEGLNVADYAASEELVLSQELLCRLLVNRSCCYFSMGLFEKSLEDSEKALSLDKENMRALYRKAKALDRLGKHQEAYGCISHRILALVQDENVTELAQELVQKLGLKQRKAYKRPQELEKFGLITNGVSASGGCKTSNGMGSVDDIFTDVPNTKVFPSSLGINYQNDGLIPSVCPPAMAPEANNVNDFDCDVIGDELDSFLESEMASKQVPQLIPVFPTGNPLLSSLGTTGLPAPSPLPPASFGLLDSRKSAIVTLKSTFVPGLDALDSFDTMRETLDSLDTFVNDAKRVEPLLVKTNQKQKQTTNTVNHLFVHKMDPVQTHISALPPLLPNPLAQNYDFKQGCQLCYVRTGPKALDFTYKEKAEHTCKKDILLARKKSSESKVWLKIRQRPMKVNFNGPYVLCKDIQSRQDCKYGDNCTFAYYPEEIDVWNEERKGALHRDQLFQLPGLVKPGSVSRLLHDQKGIFTFLCQACFESKPQIISKRNPEKPDVCTNPSKPHSFSDHKCLVHVLNSSTVKYSKIRPNHSRFQMDVCRHEARYGCHQEDACNFAHSPVELCVWMLQRQSGVTQEEIVLESERMWKVAEPKPKPPPKSLDMKMKFVCGQCLRNGREIEADRDGKYCTAKARHSWTKDKRVLLVMSKAKKKWVPIRPLPSIRSFPQQYEICVHVQNGKKCQYIGNCSFAHNTEEKDVWTFMKENKVLDLQLVFELCNKNTALAEKPGKMATASGLQKEAEKQIVMPTDYADLMDGFHCYLCGKNSNSERQWQKHIQSEKHKDRVFTLESEDGSWKYRFPAGEFKLCERYEETQSCPQESNCPFAHGREELAEWHERRKVLQYKVSKARKDMLLESSDSDFGKYSFIMQDLAEGSEEKVSAESQ
ncbi:zinc finger CCCH domain-containing protein 7B isoform X2 [Engystomops pustulosus]|uniref:zinc finger CCCH domain-containing protein 7B isoform X2 n=1 Tax=Engystomops pustulosus TaxID=76066 RepID=UPI003AFAC733